MITHSGAPGSGGVTPRMMTGVTSTMYVGLPTKDSSRLVEQRQEGAPAQSPATTLTLRAARHHHRDDRRTAPKGINLVRRACLSPSSRAPFLMTPGQGCEGARGGSPGD